ncbi:MAG: efflux RND transporter periplasmic adaptor subunit [Bryobacterales bacterium]|nr:efflux RND transporter periplasmic adaptor subunit [Bryobacterales bacterium]
MKRWLMLTFLLSGCAAGVGFGFLRLYRATQPEQKVEVPTAAVRRGDVTFSVVARGELHGGNTQLLTAPMGTSGELVLTSLPQNGTLVTQNDVIATFDTTEQEYKLREAEADLAEAEQRLAEANAMSHAKEEEGRLALLKAKADVELAQIECRKNPLLASSVARQNELALEAARDNLRQIEADLAGRKATAAAGVAIQEAARSKAQILAATAKRNIENMTLRAKTAGYVSISANMNTNMWMDGMRFPDLQIGDTVRPGVAVAQIPDLTSWEITARLSEADRGHLALGQPAAIRVAAMPGKEFRGKVKNLGGTVGPPWDRRFECKLSLDDPAAGLRPGMSVVITVTTQTVPNALWIPAQALFESDGRTFVYVKTPAGFTPQDVKLERRSESQIVVTGVKEGGLIALANPLQKASSEAKSDGAGNAMKALGK